MVYVQCTCYIIIANVCTEYSKKQLAKHSYSVEPRKIVMSALTTELQVCTLLFFTLVYEL